MPIWRRMLIINRHRFLQRLAMGTISHMVWRPHYSHGSYNPRIEYGFREAPVPTGPTPQALKALPEIEYDKLPTAEPQDEEDWRALVMMEGAHMRGWRGE